MIAGTDLDLVARAAEGDDDAYAELYRRYLPAARRRAYQLAPCQADAEDLVADAFVNVLGAIHHGHRPVPFRPYLLTTIRRGAAKLYEYRERYHTVSLYGDGGETSAPIDTLALDPDPAASWDTEPVRQAFRTLPKRWRLALWLSAVEARPPAELATLLGLTPNGAAALTCRARRGLLRAHTDLAAGRPALTKACPARRAGRRRASSFTEAMLGNNPKPNQGNVA